MDGGIKGKAKFKGTVERMAWNHSQRGSRAQGKLE